MMTDTTKIEAAIDLFEGLRAAAVAVREGLARVTDVEREAGQIQRKLAELQEANNDASHTLTDLHARAERARAELGQAEAALAEARVKRSEEEGRVSSARADLMDLQRPARALGGS
jgi:chromosome segregation ATPase